MASGELLLGEAGRTPRKDYSIFVNRAFLLRSHTQKAVIGLVFRLEGLKYTSDKEGDDTKAPLEVVDSVPTIDGGPVMVVDAANDAIVDTGVGVAGVEGEGWWPIQGVGSTGARLG